LAPQRKRRWGAETSKRKSRTGSRGSEAPQQAIDVVQLKLRPVELPGAATEFVQDLTGALKIRLLWNADVVVVRLPDAGQRAAERIASPVGLLHLRLAWHLPRLLAHHHLLSHLFGHGLQTLLKLVQRLGLRLDGGAGLSLLERLTGVPHGALRPAKGAGDLAAHFTELAHHLAKLLPQSFLLGGAGRALALLALLTLSLLPLLALPLLSTLALLLTALPAGRLTLLALLS